MKALHRGLRVLVLAASLFIGGTLSLRAALPREVGPKSPVVNLTGYATVAYVDARQGNDLTGNGSRAKPWASLPRALESVAPAAGSRAALLFSAGRYTQPTFALKPRVDLYGGFASPGGARPAPHHPRSG